MCVDEKGFVESSWLDRITGVDFQWRSANTARTVSSLNFQMAAIIEIIQPSFSEKPAQIEIHNISAWENLAKASDADLNAANQRVFAPVGRKRAFEPSASSKACWKRCKREQQSRLDLKKMRKKMVWLSTIWR